MRDASSQQLQQDDAIETFRQSYLNSGKFNYDSLLLFPSVRRRRVKHRHVVEVESIASSSK